MKKKQKKGAIPFWACRTIGKQWFEPCRKWSRILKTSRKSCNGPFWNVTDHGSKALDSDDALAIYYGSCSEKHAVMHRSTCALIRSNAILHIGCIVATCVKVVMMTPLTVVLCIICNIGTSTLCAYCIPPHGWWGQPLRFQRDCQTKIDYCLWCLTCESQNQLICCLHVVVSDTKACCLIYIPV